jgi:hypothetical protein
LSFLLRFVFLAFSTFMNCLNCCSFWGNMFFESMVLVGLGFFLDLD